MFIDRKDEMQSLGRAMASKNAELVLLYGRRRVGKSRLLLEFAKGKNALYLLGDTSKNILEVLARQTGEKFVRFSSWDDFFEYLLESGHDVVMIDEFQYLCDAEKAWPTIFQRWWERLKPAGKKIILSGSTVSTIYRVTKGYGSALYGRATLEMRIEPLRFPFLQEFFRDYDEAELVRAYCVLGGVPRYLEEFDPERSVLENITEKIFRRNSFLYNEPMNLLFGEFRDPAPYISIMQAVSNGAARFSEISSGSRIEGHKLPKYLTVLERVGLLEKEIAAGEKKVRTRNTRYRLKDNFFRFWLRFVSQNRQMVEMGLGAELFKSIKPELNAFFGRGFEEICREFLSSGKEFAFTRIGRWWLRDTEIDIVALDDERKAALFAECKWKDRVDASSVARGLLEKSALFEWNRGKRKETLAVFAKSFSRKTAALDGRRVLCFELKDIFRRHR